MAVRMTLPCLAAHQCTAHNAVSAPHLFHAVCSLEHFAQAHNAHSCRTAPCTSHWLLASAAAGAIIFGGDS
jgi:hypothetical protein